MQFAPTYQTAGGRGAGQGEGRWAGEGHCVGGHWVEGGALGGGRGTGRGGHRVGRGGGVQGPRGVEGRGTEREEECCNQELAAMVFLHPLLPDAGPGSPGH